MEYKVIRTETGNLLVSDSVKVSQFSEDGKASLRNIPDLKMFRELGYVIPPYRVEAESPAEAASKIVSASK